MTGRKPRIVLMPGNDAISDPRSLKNLAAISAMGCEGIALGVSRSGQSWTRDVAGGTVRLVASPPRVARVGALAWLSDLRTLVTPWYRTPSQAKDARARAAHLAVDARKGWQLRDAGREPLVHDPGLHGKRQRTPSRVASLARRVVIRLRALPFEWSEQRANRLRDVSHARRALAIRLHRTGPWRARWRRVLPEILDDERNMGAVLDELEPDVIHVHDIFMMGVAASAAARAAAAGRTVKLVYDAREHIPGLAHLRTRRVAAYCDLEREFIQHFDAVVTVSDAIADNLVETYGLVERPRLVLNAPVVGDAASFDRDVRTDVGLGQDVPLAVYLGVVNPARGVQTAVDALVHDPQLNVAIVTGNVNRTVELLLQRAKSAGTGDRLHVLPPVPPEFVVPYVATADAGLSPLLHAPNHHLTLTNKFCEYVVARVPVVTSDTFSQRILIEQYGVGAIYPAGDAAALARAIATVRSDRKQITAALAKKAVQERFSWEAQGAALRDTYEQLLGSLPRAAHQKGALTIKVVTSDAR